MKRREFINFVGLGCLASSLPVAIAACQSSDPNSSLTETKPTEKKVKIDTTPREDGYAAVGTVAKLDDQGFLSNKAFFAGAVAVIRNPADEATLLAVNSLCPHQGCSVAWKTESNQFICPCHQSTFNPDGSLVSGPAAKDLETFEVKAEGDLVLIKVS